MKARKLTRQAVRTAILITTFALAAGVPVGFNAARIIPALSPLVILAGFIAGRTWVMAGISLLVLALAVWKGRLFCRWICPLGTIYALPSALSLRMKLLRQPVAGYVFWIIIGMAIAGAPLLLFLDPLSTFNRLSPFARGIRFWPMLVPALIVPFFFILNFLQPMIWCAYICPLGYMFDLSYKQPFIKTIKTDPGRRLAIAGLFIGLPMGFIASKFGIRKEKDKRLPTLPPGAGRQEHFSATCTRCYACVNACAKSTGVLTVKAPDGMNLNRFFQPELDTRHSYCSENCNRCSQVCPVGSIRRLNLEEKRHRQIGLAKLDRTLCLAWEYGEYCMICEEYCPYGAIDRDYSAHKLPRPMVNPNLCRGCGACEHACPARKTAIVVHGLPEQKQLPS